MLAFTPFAPMTLRIELPAGPSIAPRVPGVSRLRLCNRLSIIDHSILNLDIPQTRIHRNRHPTLAQVLSAALTEVAFEHKRIAGIGFVGHVRDVAEKRNETDDEVESHVEKHVHQHAAGERGGGGGADDHQCEHAVEDIADDGEDADYAGPTFNRFRQFSVPSTVPGAGKLRTDSKPAKRPQRHVKPVSASLHLDEHGLILLAQPRRQCLLAPLHARLPRERSQLLRRHRFEVWIFIVAVVVIAGFLQDAVEYKFCDQPRHGGGVVL